MDPERGGIAMAETIRIQMMDHFLIFIDEQKTDHLSAKSKKGAALIQYLILTHCFFQTLELYISPCCQP